MPMKVLHLATSEFGGAGIAAVRMNEALKTIGVDSELISRDGDDSKYFSRIDEIKSSTLTFLQRRIIQNSSSLMTPLGVDLSKRINHRISQATVLHLHASYNLVSLNFLASLDSKKLVVITFHDERYLTGGCHVSYGCERFLDSCVKCPQSTLLGRPVVSKSFQKSERDLKGSKKLVLVAPSNWMYEKVKHHPLYSKFKTYEVENPIPSMFEAGQRDLSSQESFNDGKMNLTFIASDINNPIKNIFTLKKALNLLDLNILSKIRLNLVGEGSYSGFPKKLEVVHHGHLDETRVSRLLKRTSILFVISVQDNLPSVIGEGLMAGCYVIGSHVGGIPKILKNFNMPVIDPLDSKSLENEIKKAVILGSETPDIALANKFFAYESVATKMKEIYETNLT
jgi:glycosyltransferase involved in cell wall biosynthesis